MAFSSMWIGATGMTAYSDGMQVVSNNLANVNTTAFKTGQSIYQDIMYEAVGYSGADENGQGGSINAIGNGVALAAVYTEFTQGAITEGSTVTDLALDGKGFFKVVKPGNNEVYYTRDGTFRFDSEGNLVNSLGYNVQGYPILESGLGAAAAIKLPVVEQTNAYGETVYNVISEAKATSSVDMILNLDSSAEDETTDPTSPFFALAKTWQQSSSSKDIGESSFQNAIKVYDSSGESHVLSVTFDKVTQSNSGNQYWEYVVTVDPSEDGRSSQVGVPEGLLMMGTMTFDSVGSLIDQSAYTPDTSMVSTSNAALDLSLWKPAQFSADGTPTFSVAFNDTYASNGQSYVTDTQTISLNFGLSSSTSTWTNGELSAGEVGSNAGNLASMQGATKATKSSTGYDAASGALTQDQDGYATGYMNSMEVDGAGVLTLNFSNGQQESIYQLTVATFASENGLYQAGNNLYRATADSGAANEGVAGTEGRGTVNSQSLEASNVDMADQFSKMILTQRGFQANSKVITTSDTVVGTLISMKR